MNTTVTLQSLSFSNIRTYIAAALFVAGNILLPQLFHLFPHGGIIWLPIYFFTLVGAYKYGWRVGLLTAVVSPLVSSALFGMPMAGALPAIILKSSLLAIAAGAAAHYFHKATLLTLISVVLGYQIVGTLGEWAIVGDFWKAAQDFRMGIPGMLLQIVGGWWVINRINIFK
jgi:hypothetical protein